MKSIILSPTVPQKRKFKNEDIETVGRLITRALLEKDKPKVFFNIENWSEKKTQRRLA